MSLDRKVSTLAGILILGMYSFVLGYLLVIFSRTIEENTRFNIERSVQAVEYKEGVE